MDESLEWPLRHHVKEAGEQTNIPFDEFVRIAVLLLNTVRRQIEHYVGRYIRQVFLETGRLE